MNINVVDCSIILLLILGVIIGFKSGIIKKLVSTFGMIACILVAYFLKGPVSGILYNLFPFFSFGGKIKGLTSLNILLYELIAFFLLFAILMIVYGVLVKLASITEKFLKATIVLSIPSKILGAVFGFIETYIIIFIILFIINMPMFNIKVFKESKMSNYILNNTPVISNVTEKALNSVNDINNEINKDANTNEINNKIMDILVDNKIISKKQAEKLIKNDKLK